jgi:transcriptional regulator with XRE-family HTH domain
MANNTTTDPVMGRARAAFERSGLSLEEVGRQMGYGEETARKSAWQFLNKTRDPRLSMLRKFARAVGVRLRDLVDE